MTFIKEMMPEEYRKKIEARKDFMFWRADEWLIDKENDVQFYSIGGNPRGTETAFDFVWKGNLIRTGGTWGGNPESKFCLNWNVSVLDIPECLQDQKQEIVSSLIEAFETYSTIGVINKEMKVKVIFEKN